MSYKFEKFNGDIESHMEAAEVISGWSMASETMASYSPDEIKSHPLGILAIGEHGEVQGYLAVTDFYEKTAKVGALAVCESKQGNGLARQLVEVLSGLIKSEIPEATLAYAYVHDGSKNKFLDSGYEKVGDRQPPAPTGCNTIVAKNLA